VLLLISECSVFKSYFVRDWPLLSPSNGFNFLGFCMLVLGNNTLGNLNKEATSQKSLGLPLWRLVIGSGIVVFVFGFINIVVVCYHPFSLRYVTSLTFEQNYIFRDAKLKVTARQVRAKGAVAISEGEAAIEAEKLQGHTPSMMSSFPPGSSIYSSPTIHKSPVKSFFRNARDSILPSYHSRHVTYTPSPARDAKSPSKQSEPMSPSSPMEISAPMNINPQFAHLIKPELAHHPSNRRPDGSF
jgi:hypothetical protein